MKESEATVLVATLAAAFPRQQLAEPTIKVYAHDLVDLDAAAANAAIETLRRTSRFFPTISEIREATAALQLGAPEPMRAWEQACGRGPRHPLVQRARRIVGDDYDWRVTPTGIMRRSFRDAYAEVRAEAVRALVSPTLDAAEQRALAERPALEEAACPECGLRGALHIADCSLAPPSDATAIVRPRGEDT